MASLKGKKILIIDDAEADRMLMSTYLQLLGCRVYHAHDGMDGVHKGRLLRPDLILMDFDMPQCNGYAACKVLKGDPATSHIPILFISGFSEPSHRVQGLLAGAVDYIGKPYDFDEVRLRLSVHLNNHSENENKQENMTPERTDQQQGLNEVLFQSARVQLLKSLDTSPRLDELSRKIGTNSKRLNQAFKHCVGITVFEYLREERMKEARQLLEQTQIPIVDIAERVGFSSSANFSTAFKERFGASPSRYRQGLVNDSTRTTP